MNATKWAWGAGILLLLGYLALSWIGIHSGIATLDANGIMAVAGERLRTGAFDMSRPPGHPLNEYWLLPAYARLLGERADISPEVYGSYQLLGGLIALGSFWLLLAELPLSMTRKLLATACLAFSPHFLFHSSDGEEFLWGMALIFAVLVIISRLAKGQFSRPSLGWSFAAVAAVAASGFRVEFGAVALGIVFVTLLVSDRKWIEIGSLALMVVALLGLLWWPVVQYHGTSMPFPNPISLQVRFGVGLYKIIFHALGVLPLILAVLILFQVRGRFGILPSAGQDILVYWISRLVLVFFALFFAYPTKIEVVLPGVAFLVIWVALHAGERIWTGFVIACLMVQLVQIDCFENRQWTGLKLEPSLWQQSLAKKPAFQGRLLESASRMAREKRVVLTLKVWPWDFAWQKRHGFPFGAPVVISKGQDMPIAYHLGEGILASRSILDNPELLAALSRQGYMVQIDQDLYREVFLRYNLAAPTPSHAKVDGIDYQVVKLNP